MWLILLTIMVWVPLFVMSVTFVVIWIKIRYSFKTFPYLSHQSYNARSRKKVIRMLLLLILMELICWAPWSFFVICDYIIDKYYQQQGDNIFHNPYPMVKKKKSNIDPFLESFFDEYFQCFRFSGGLI